MKYTTTYQDLNSLCNIGGKGHNLRRLQQHFRVPEWFGLSVDAFNLFLQENALNEQIKEILQSGTVTAQAKKIRQLIENSPMPKSLEAEISQKLGQLTNDYVSVRSSAADEDGGEFSFAGIHESFLYVRGAENVIQHVKKVWASGYHDRALVYRKENDLSIHPVPMAVIVQRMINAESSGVVFTINPTNLNVDELVISSLYGLGEGLVGVGLEADHFVYHKNSNKTTENIATKSSQMLLDPEDNMGLKEVDVSSDLQEKSSLNSNQIDELVQVSSKLEKLSHRPQDIEFCYEKGQLYLLQTRDITTAEEYGPAVGNQQIWDNSNIIESYSGVTSPMTFSFIKESYSVVYNCFSKLMGIPARTIAENQTVYKNMLGLINGQVYYNLPNWYRLVQQFPGYDYNKKFMESMMGVKDKIETNGEQKESGFFRKNFIELPKLFKLVAGMGTKFIGLKRSVPKFNNNFDQYYNRWDKMDFEQMMPAELMAVYQSMQKNILVNWQTPIVNDFHVMIFYGTLKSICTKWCGDDNGSLQNNLICGEGDIESTVPTKLLMKLAADIQESELNALFSEDDPLKLMNCVKDRDDTKFITDAVEDYLHKYGFRCIHELKLEEPSLHETPEFIYQIISNYVRMDRELLDTEKMRERENSIRLQAEKDALGQLSWFKKSIFKFILKQARNGVKNRENMRFARTKIYGQIRLLLNAIGSHFVTENIINEQQDIYYLTMDEVWDYIKGTAVTTQLDKLIELRKNEFDSYENMEEDPDNHFTTYGMVYHKNKFKNRDVEVQELAPGTLRGISCSPGKVSGIARVIKSPRDNIKLSGEILIADRTDPGWVPLYPSVSGILIERGSVLSHSAIVAREMGIPAIVGIPNLTKTIKDGDFIEVNATTGEILIKENDNE